MATHRGETNCATADYIYEMLKELRTMSQKIDEDFLVYLLEMASMEASDIANGQGTRARQASYIIEKPKTPSADELAKLFLEGAYD